MNRPPGSIQPFAESWRTTALRTVSLALAVGVGVGLIRRQVAVVPSVTLFALWFTLGGHYLELFFRNRLRSYLGHQPATVALARIVFWFAGGSLLFEGAMATRALFTTQVNVSLSWWLAGVGFAGVELLIHLGLRARGEPSFYDGRG